MQTNLRGSSADTRAGTHARGSPALSPLSRSKDRAFFPVGPLVLLSLRDVSADPQQGTMLHRAEGRDRGTCGDIVSHPKRDADKCKDVVPYTDTRKHMGQRRGAAVPAGMALRRAAVAAGPPGRGRGSCGSETPGFRVPPKKFFRQWTTKSKNRDCIALLKIGAN